MPMLSGYFYECCGIMGSFPPADSIEEAIKNWNELQRTKEES